MFLAAIEAPVITGVTRFNPTAVSVEVEVTENEQAVLEHFVVDIYNATGNRNLDLLVHTYIHICVPECCLQTEKSRRASSFAS